MASLGLKEKQFFLRYTSVVSFSEGAPKQLRGNASPQNRITEHKEYFKQDTNYFLSPKTGHYFFETGHYFF
jgi:hypothetical protein